MSTNSDRIIRRVKNRENPYSMISNTVINDVRLSWKARGILVYLLSKPDDWYIYVSQLVKESPDGRESVETGINELRHYGYIELVCVRRENGQVDHWEYTIYEEPIEVSEEERAKINQKRLKKQAREQRKAEKRKQQQGVQAPETGKPDLAENTLEPETGIPLLGSPDLGFPHLLNTDSTKHGTAQKTDIKDNNKEPVVADNDRFSILSKKVQENLRESESIEAIQSILNNTAQKVGVEQVERNALYVASRGTYKSAGGLRAAIIEDHATMNGFNSKQPEHKRPPEKEEMKYLDRNLVTYHLLFEGEKLCTVLDRHPEYLETILSACVPEMRESLKMGLQAINSPLAERVMNENAIR